MVAYPDGNDVWASGEVTGVITPEAIGQSGFGYDPVFAPEDGGGDTFAQMSSRGEAPDLASGPCLPCARRSARGATGVPVILDDARPTGNFEVLRTTEGFG